MSVLLAVLGLFVKAILLVCIVLALALIVWVLWDCTVGPSAQLAAARRRREGVRSA